MAIITDSQYIVNLCWRFDLDQSCMSVRLAKIHLLFMLIFIHFVDSSTICM